MGLAEIRGTLDRHGLRLQRELGQSFLVEDAIAERLPVLAAVEPGDAVLEIGTGLGVLTRALAARAERVVTIEIDAGLVRALRADEALPENVELRHQDALAVDLRACVSELGPGRVKVVANLPYSAASPLLRRLLDLADVLVDWSVMVQRELADRLVAEPGTRSYGSPTVLHALVVDVVREIDLKAGCFFPPPRVDSSFVRMIPRQTSPLAAGELALVEPVVRGAFGQRRKTLANALRGAGRSWSSDPGAIASAIERAGADPRARAETLPPEAFLELSRALRAGTG